MASKIFQLKESVLREIPRGELPWQVMGRLMLKTGFPWTTIKEDTEVTESQLNASFLAAKEIFGKEFTV